MNRNIRQVHDSDDQACVQPSPERLTRRKFLSLFAAGGAAAALAACGASASPAPPASSSGVTPAGSGTASGDTLPIGAIMPLSGPLSVVGLAWGRGFELYFDKLNAQGGIKAGDKRYAVKYILEDGKGNAEAAGAAANKLVNQDGAKFVFGEILDAAARAIYQVTAPKQALHLITWATPGSDADVKADKPLAVRLGVSSLDSQPLLVSQLAKAYPNAKKIAISAPDIGYERMIDNVTKAAASNGQEIIYVEKWQWGTQDFVPTYTKIMANNPDAIWVMVSGQSRFQVKTARDLGFKGVLIDDTPLDPDVHIRTTGAGATDLLVSGMNISKPTDAMSEVIAAWKSKFSDPFVSDALLAWDHAWTLTQAFEKAGSIEPQAVLTALEGMTAPGSVKTVFGGGHIGGAKQFGANRVLERPVPIVRVVNGQKDLLGLFMPEST